MWEREGLPGQEYKGWEDEGQRGMEGRGGMVGSILSISYRERWRQKQKLQEKQEQR